MSTHLSELFREAREGPSDALEFMGGAIREMVHAIAMRMPHHPFDIENIIEKILIKK